MLAHFDQFALGMPAERLRNRVSSRSFSGVLPPARRWTETSRPVDFCLAAKAPGARSRERIDQFVLLIEVHALPRYSTIMRTA